MIKLQEGMSLYHGSYVVVSRIDLARCIAGKDFGRGFYVTSSYEQARRLVTLSVRRAVRMGLVPQDCSSGFVSHYRFSPKESLDVTLYQQADADWLHLVACNRDVGLFPLVLEKHQHCDVIGGKIANDRTAQTLQFYMAGAFGVPGQADADEMAIRTLLPNRLEDQFCFRTERSLAALEFVEAQTVV